MQVSNLTDSRGNIVPNQFVIKDDGYEIFQSYNSIIVKKIFNRGKTNVLLDKTYWKYSSTTSKYRSVYLKETTKETEEKIKTGEYILSDLNNGA